jgi:predicted AAA+ superfamily ATPase
MRAKRYLTEQVILDLSKKMVFLGGPRQVGKTTLGKSLPGGKLGYLNWDAQPDREAILDRKFPNSPLWFLDEIHKFKKWRGFIKGIYDTKEEAQQILVSGSARLDLYRFGGDSLQGRYHFLRLHPLSVAEIGCQNQKELEEIYKLGPFPEPFFSSSQVEARRWSREYKQRLIKEDVSTLENLTDLDSVLLLANLLPERVGSLLSANSLSEDLSYSVKTIAKWISILEKVYFLFRIQPFSVKMTRAIQKAQKHYHFDWTLVKDEGARFENFVASHLLKWAQFQEDTLGLQTEIKFYRDQDNREVDFVVLQENQVIQLIECKTGPGEISKSLKYLKTKFPSAEAIQVTLHLLKEYKTAEGIKAMSALNFLKTRI